MSRITRSLLFMIMLFVVGSTFAPVAANAQHRRHHRHFHHRHHHYPRR